MNEKLPALKLSNLVVRYGNGCNFCKNDISVMQKNRCPYCKSIWAVRDVSLDVYNGEILGIVGESGSGKSTLMKALYMDIEVNSGEYVIYKNGLENIFDETIQEKKHVKNHMLGMVYQNPHLGLRMHFSCGANVAERLISSGERNVAQMNEITNGLLEHLDLLIHIRII